MLSIKSVDAQRRLSAKHADRFFWNRISARGADLPATIDLERLEFAVRSLGGAWALYRMTCTERADWEGAAGGRILSCPSPKLGN